MAKIDVRPWVPGDTLRTPLSLSFEGYSLCIYCVHCEGAVPRRCLDMVRELSRHFDHVIVSATTEEAAREISLSAPSSSWHASANDTYDVGLFYKAWRGRPAAFRAGVKRLCFANDSNVLVKPLDAAFSWAAREGPDFWGLTDCSHIRYHVQSPFLVFEAKAIPVLDRHLDSCGVGTWWKEVGPEAIRSTVISNFEVVIADRMALGGCTVGVYTRCVAAGLGDNAAVFNPGVLVSMGHPMVKRQCVRREL